ncbi:AAA-ATPase-like domain-containing protein [Rozella allomycis CSF55]|uniref:AAA-ATPase-like domain-containing protein n=1 Tax=Rozella allomycis (strain CSF55) TaxID=988480 RepID=A0A075ASE7_ROZAC|nr:AAA-ATPase-like domain-containing protein [Rozella allomycis CSF55]|eukprot:EPZ31483.1 AAA-ATPase-like domain-containing protein [Rozella allomycis CSF55]
MKPVLADSSSFDQYRKSDAFFVDKSLFIEEFINNGCEVDVILRPRGFGKSLNLSMLKSFFRIGNDPSLFKDLKINEKKELMEKYCGTYPVVHLDLKDVVGSTWESTLTKLWQAVQRMAEEHRDVIDQTYHGKDMYLRDDLKSDPPRRCLSNLINILRKYYKQRVIVLIDEYDAPLENAHREGFFEQAIDFFWSFFSAALKGNDSLEKACVMGMFEIRKDGIMMSQFDNFVVHSYSNMRYSSCFGFTLEEVRQLGLDEGDVEKAMNLYDGYYFRDSKVSNPYSIMTWLKNGKKYESYWVGTTRPFIAEFIKGLHQFLPMEIYTLLLDRNGLELTLKHAQTDFYDSDWKLCEIINYLVLTGYLTYRLSEKLLMIPNKELRDHWTHEVLPSMNNTAKSTYGDHVSKVFNQDPFDETALKVLMRQILVNSFAHNVNLIEWRNRESHEKIRIPVAAYHCLFFGIFHACIHDGQNVIVESRMEGIEGRCNVRITFPHTKKVFIMEFSVCEDNRNFDHECDAAFNQIQDNEYYRDLNGYTVHLISVTCYMKRLSLKQATINA